MAASSSQSKIFASVFLGTGICDYVDGIATLPSVIYPKETNNIQNQTSRNNDESRSSDEDPKKMVDAKQQYR